MTDVLVAIIIVLALGVCVSSYVALRKSRAERARAQAVQREPGEVDPPTHVTYRGVGLAAFTPTPNIVRRTRSPRVPTVKARRE